MSPPRMIGYDHVDARQSSDVDEVDPYTGAVVSGILKVQSALMSLPGAQSKALVYERLRWMAQVLGPSLSRALQATGPVDLKVITSQALQMGDECHNRNVAATALFTRQLAPALVRQVDGQLSVASTTSDPSIGYTSV